jgi:hypothetical protein
MLSYRTLILVLICCVTIREDCASAAVEFLSLPHTYTIDDPNDEQKTPDNSEMPAPCDDDDSSLNANQSEEGAHFGNLLVEPVHVHFVGANDLACIASLRSRHVLRRLRI